MMKKSKRNIKSSKLTLKFSNKNKLEKLYTFTDEYKRVTQEFVNLIWGNEKVPILLPKEITSKVGTWLSARMLQACGKQASGIVRGTREKQSKRKWKIDDFNSKGMFKKARKLQEIYDKVSVSKPELKTIECELDSRFIKQDFKNKTTFDGWISITSIGDKMKLVFPVKQSKHFNKMIDRKSVV